MPVHCSGIFRVIVYLWLGSISGYCTLMVIVSVVVIVYLWLGSRCCYCIVRVIVSLLLLYV